MHSELAVERVKDTYAFAITSLAAGRSFGVVVNKNRNGPGGNCYVIGMTADLR